MQGWTAQADIIGCGKHIFRPTEAEEYPTEVARLPKLVLTIVWGANLAEWQEYRRLEICGYPEPLDEFLANVPWDATKPKG